MNIKRAISTVLIMSIMTVQLAACDISSKHLEMSYESNNNESISVWDDIGSGGNVDSWDDESYNVVTWDEIDEYSDFVYSELLFDDIAVDMPIVESKVLDFKSNGQYFDGDKVYQLVNDQFDANSFVAKYAVGTGVIVVLVILHVATSGGSTPICCMIAGAAKGSVDYAVKGAAFSAAINAVVEYIKSGGDIDSTLYESLEGSSDGYMWGAIFGAITGGWNSRYCFTADTLVETNSGKKQICDICVGDLVYSYNEDTKCYMYSEVTQITNNTTKELIEITVGDDIIKCTPEHPFLTDNGWVLAGDLTNNALLLTSRGDYSKISSVNKTTLSEPVETYNLCVDNTHTFTVGNSGIVVHNACVWPNKKYAGKTYYFPEGSPQALKYPNGVPFTEAGYPDFSQYAIKTATFEYPSSTAIANKTCLLGNCSSDFTMANTQVGLSSTPTGYVWHHVEDCQTMLLVPQDLHNVAMGGVAHRGGEAEIAKVLTEIITN